MIIRLVSFIGPPSVLDWLESFIGSTSEIPAREFYWPAECTCAVIRFYWSFKRRVCFLAFGFVVLEILLALRLLIKKQIAFGKGKQNLEIYNRI